MYTIELPEIFRPKGFDSLVRLGKCYDGGYIVDLNSVLDSDCLLSFGINEDWSFEEDFLKKNLVRLYAFDGSINKNIFLNKIRKSLKNFNLKHVFKNSNKYISFKNFFDGINKFHIEKHIGLDFEESFVSIPTIFAKYLNNKYRKIFFKIDIEGSEYRILEDLIRYQNITSGLVIEFHDFDINLDRIIVFLNKYNLHLCHIHANNFAPINCKIPLSIELSFTTDISLKVNNINYPSELDMPNNSRKLDYKFEFV